MTKVQANRVILRSREGTPLIPVVAADDIAKPDSKNPITSGAAYDIKNGILEYKEIKK